MPYIPHPWDKYGGPGARKTRAQTRWEIVSAIGLVVGLVAVSWIVALALGKEGEGQVILFVVVLVASCMVYGNRRSGPRHDDHRDE